MEFDSETIIDELIAERERADYTINCAQEWIERFYKTVKPVFVSQLTSQIKALSKTMQGRSASEIRRATKLLLDAQTEVLMLGTSAAPASNHSLPRVHREWEECAQRGLSATAKNPNGPVFVSYAHADAKWLSRLLIHLRPLERTGRIQLWHDRKLTSGDRWRREITDVVNSASVAILLVSANFMASDFIYDKELPPIVQRAKAKGVKVFPLIVGHCLFDEDEFLGEFQTVNDPEIPLSRLSPNAVDKIFVNLAKDVLKQAGMNSN